MEIVTKLLKPDARWVDAKRMTLDDGSEVVIVIQGSPVEDGTIIQVDVIPAIKAR